MRIKEIKSILKDTDQTKCIYFDFASQVPTVIDSWRGSYCEPAIGWGNTKPLTVKDFLDELDVATSGKIYYGYKGGEYTFSEDQELYVDNYGMYTQTVITKINDKGYCVILCTEQQDY